MCFLHNPSQNIKKVILISFIILIMTQNQTIFLATLVLEFWLSGLFVLSVIFLDIPDLDSLTLYTFLSYAVGSFLAGVLSDKIGRKPIFMVCSCVLFLSSLLVFWNLTAGLILANACIGPLNNLTFVFIN